MANEATLVFEQEAPIPFTVSNTTGIEKGTLCKMSDPMTAAIHTASTDMLAGIAASEKIASDGKTHLGMYRKGIFKMLASGTIPIGAALTCGVNANTVLAAAVTASGAAILGHALETAAAAETFLVAVNIGAGSNGIA